jgi:cellulose biosynthesis protein BcsQ
MSTTDDAPSGEIITFYSYKGGTGRSMVLANVAYLLAKQPSASGRRILAIDWDLEAPGLHRYFQKEFGASIDKRPGLIDLFCDVRSFYEKRESKSPLPESAADSDESRGAFRDAMKAHPFEKYRVAAEGVARLDLMTAGAQDPEYANRVRQFDWEHFYLNHGSFLTHLRDLLMKNYDYVLIDSRTGLTDTSGICTRVMPEKLVTVFAPNRQNIEGVENAIRRAVKYRLDSRDPRGLAVFPLASRLDASASRLRELWWHGGGDADAPVVGYQPTFEKLFRDLFHLEECDLEAHFAATQVPHDSDYAYGEKIAAREHTTDRLSIGYAIANLTTRLTRLSDSWDHLPDEDAAAAKRKAEEAKKAAAEGLSRSEREVARARQARLANVLTLVVMVGVAIFFGIRSWRKAGDSKLAVESLVAGATARNRAGDPNGALALADQALAKDAKFLPAYVVRVEAFLQKRDVPGAEGAFAVIPAGSDPTVVKYLDVSIKDWIKKATDDARQAAISNASFDQMPDPVLGGSKTGRAALEAAIGELRMGVHSESATKLGWYRGRKVDLYNKAAGVKLGSPWGTSFVLWCLAQAGWKPPGEGPTRADDLRTSERFHPARAYLARPGDLVILTGGIYRNPGAGKDEDSPYVAIVHHTYGERVWAIEGSVVNEERGDNLKRVMGAVYDLPDVAGFVEVSDPPPNVKQVAGGSSNFK